MKKYYAEKASTRGILEVEAEFDPELRNPFMRVKITEIKKWKPHLGYDIDVPVIERKEIPKNQLFDTFEEAVERGKTVIKKRIETLKNEIAKLEAIDIESLGEKADSPKP